MESLLLHAILDQVLDLHVHTPRALSTNFKS